MKRILYLTILMFFALSLHAQNLDIDGKTRIEEMDKNNESNSVVVRLNDGELEVRDVSSLIELSSNGDTIFWEMEISCS